MKVKKLSLTDAKFERSPGQDGDILTGDLVDERHGGPVTIGYGRWGANETLSETMAVHDVMIVLEGHLSVSSDTGTVDAGPSDIVYMPEGEKVTIRAHAQGAVTAYVTHPHWRAAAMKDK